MNFQPISSDFFQQGTIDLAKNLIGQYIVHQHPQIIVAKIIETAYMGPEDRAHIVSETPNEKNRSNVW
jgi:DNA-3-methyladenine glycosylase